MAEVEATPFNSALEAGVRTLTVLIACYPTKHDLGRLVQYDYLTVHSADADGPPSLHPPLPFRSGELLVRRGLIDAGLNLMISRSLVQREQNEQGVFYGAHDAAGAFLDNLQSSYITQLCERAEWVSATFDNLNPSELDRVVKQLFDAWTTEFQPAQMGTQSELLI